MTNSSLVLLSTLALGVGASGCMYQRLRDPQPASELPGAYSSTAAAGAGSPAGEGGEAGIPVPPAAYEASELTAPWWDQLGDPALDAIIRRALAVNLSLNATRARVRQAEALAEIARSSRFPQISFEARFNVGTQRSAFQGNTRAIQVSASLPVSYEVDLWARRSREAEASRLDVEAMRLDAQAAYITLVASTTEAWFDLRAVRAQRDLMVSQQANNQTYLELVELRFQQGLASAVDVHQQRVQVADADAQLALLAGTEEVLRQRLSILIGEPPSAPFPEAEATLPELPAPPDAQFPASLLMNRPDVRAAARRIEASDRRVSAAIAQRLPTIVLHFTPTYGWSTSEIIEPGENAIPGVDPNRFTGAVSGFTYQAGAQLTVPLFDGFRGRAMVELERARVAESVETFHDVILHALVEVEAALVQERQERVRLLHLERRIELTAATLDAAQARYRQGLSDFLPVLSAIAMHQGAEAALLDARRQLISHRIQLHRALGGTWPEALIAEAEGNDE
jgi:NodT family efflux transporter outer membrane factor (OMF) lipoprotein